MPEAVESQDSDGIERLSAYAAAQGGERPGERALEIRPGLKVLYTSGYAEDAIVHHGRLDSGVQLPGKPYRRSELARRARAAIDAEPQ